MLCAFGVISLTNTNLNVKSRKISSFFSTHASVVKRFYEWRMATTKNMCWAAIKSLPWKELVTRVGTKWNGRTYIKKREENCILHSKRRKRFYLIHTFGMFKAHWCCENCRHVHAFHVSKSTRNGNQFRPTLKCVLKWKQRIASLKFSVIDWRRQPEIRLTLSITIGIRHTWMQPLASPSHSSHRTHSRMT